MNLLKLIYFNGYEYTRLEKQLLATFLEIEDLQTFHQILYYAILHYLEVRRG